MSGITRRHGAHLLPDGDCLFRVWAPHSDHVHLVIQAPEPRSIGMERAPLGYHEVLVPRTSPGTRYLYRLATGVERPDPASRWQPSGVHEASAVAAPSFAWSDRGWRGLPLEDYVIYELHVGTYTSEGTFDAIHEHLPSLRRLGITAVEIMPVAQFPGDRNWGYDGAYPFAAQNSYGGPEGLRRLVDACHRNGLAVVLDVVYNHLGPEGNYFSQFGPYFTDRYRTPWGAAINFDGRGSDEVRHFFIENALYWIDVNHIDALRLDAVHAIRDHSAYPFLQELAEAVHRRAIELNRRVHVIAESDLNDPRLVRPRERGGLGHDAVWNDDFHHCIHALLTGERTGYYADYGDLDELVRCCREGFAYAGRYSRYRGRRHGAPSDDVPAYRFVVASQNHDQVGNRMLGERLSQLVSFEALKVAAGMAVLSPFVPLIFMGEEYGETAPFCYFVSHSDPKLIEAVRRGRREEFAQFRWRGEAPDPQDPETFHRSKLDHARKSQGRHALLWSFHQTLLRLRRELPSLANLNTKSQEVVGWPEPRILLIRRWCPGGEVFSLVNFSDRPSAVHLPLRAGTWTKRLDSADPEWGGPGSSLPSRLELQASNTVSPPPTAIAVFDREE